jgi:hypothetical protein
MNFLRWLRIDNDAPRGRRTLAFGIIGGECTLLDSRAVCYQREEPSMEHLLRKPVESRHAYEQRRKTLAFGVVLALSLALALVFVLLGCGSVTSTSSGSAAPPPAVAALSAAGFEAPAQIRADQILINGVRLPCQKFLRNPTN